MKLPLRVLLGVAALLFFAIAVYYLITPANALAGFVPGHDPHSAATHTKHALAAGLLGVGCLVGLWFSTGKKPADDSTEQAE